MHKHIHIHIHIHVHVSVRVYACVCVMFFPRGNPTPQNAMARVWLLQILVSAINFTSSLDSVKQRDPHPFHLLGGAVPLRIGYLTLNTV